MIDKMIRYFENGMSCRVIYRQRKQEVYSTRVMMMMIEISINPVRKEIIDNSLQVIVANGIVSILLVGAIFLSNLI